MLRPLSPDAFLVMVGGRATRGKLPVQSQECWRTGRSWPQMPCLRLPAFFLPPPPGCAAHQLLPRPEGQVQGAHLCAQGARPVCGEFFCSSCLLALLPVPLPVLLPHDAVKRGQAGASKHSLDSGKAG